MIGIFYSVLAALGDLGGGALVIWRSGRDRGALASLTGFGAGFLLAVVVIGMLPEAAELDYGFIAVLVGFLGVHLTQHTLTPHFHFGEETHTDAMISRDIGVWALVGLLPHSFFDGVAISAAFIKGDALGILVFAGILLHKVPTGVSLASVMLASGNSRRQTLVAVLAIGLATVVGAAITPLLGDYVQFALPLAAGVTLYVAASNLIPEAQHERSWGVQGGLFLGVIAYFVLRAVMPHPH